MNSRRRMLVTAALLAALPALAADLRVLTAGALKPLVVAQAPAFERQTGHRLLIENDTAGRLTRQVQEGREFDVVIVTKAGIEQLTSAGKLALDSATPLARIGIGVAVLQGAPKPDISTLTAFRQTLLQARSVALIDAAAGGSSGIYLARLFESMGIAEDIRRKALPVPGGLVAQKLVSREADLALQQITELFEVPGVAVLGPIPAEVQNYTTYSGAVAAGSPQAAAARALLAALAQSAGQPTWRERGFTAP